MFGNWKLRIGNYFASAFGVLSLLGLYCHAPLARAQELSLEAPAVGITLDPAAESPRESHLRVLLRRAGLPRPEVNGKVTDEHGGFLARNA